MRKRKKILVMAVAAFVILTAGLTTFALAQETSVDKDDTSKGPVQTLVTKVANILEIEEEQLVSAFKQARQEMINEALEQRLQRAIEKGYIDEPEANEILEWWQNKPDVLHDLGNSMRSDLREVLSNHRLLHRILRP